MEQEARDILRCGARRGGGASQEPRNGSPRAYSEPFGGVEDIPSQGNRCKERATAIRLSFLTIVDHVALIRNVVSEFIAAKSAAVSVLAHGWTISLTRAPYSECIRPAGRSASNCS